MSFSSSPSWGTRSFTFGDTTGLPRQRTPTPSVRQESVIENVEKKQRENLKSRLKLLSALPSRSRSKGSVGVGGAEPSPMPVIVREPPVRVTLPKAVPSSPSRRYTSVLTSSDQQLDPAGQKSRLVRRHSVGSLVYQYRKERSPSETNGNGLKKDDFKSRSSIHIARDDLGFNLSKYSPSSDRNRPNTGGTSSKSAVQIVRDDLGSTWPKVRPEPDKSRPANGSSHPQNSSFDFDRRPKLSNEHTNDDDRPTPEGNSDNLISYEIASSTPKHETTKESEAGNRINGNLINGGNYKSRYLHNGGEAEDIDDVFNATSNFNNLDLKKDVHNDAKAPHETTKDQQFQNGVVQSSENVKPDSKESTELINFDLPHGGTTGRLSVDLHAPLLINKEAKPEVLTQIELIQWDNVDQSGGKSESYAKEPGFGANEAKIDDYFEATKQNNSKELEIDNKIIQKYGELFEINASSESHSPASSQSANKAMEPIESAVATLIDLEVNSSDEKTLRDHVDEVLGKADNNFRSGSLDIVIKKSRDSGLGFCIEGGMGHPDGDKPITVKRVFAEHPSTPKHLKVGDELSVVANEDMAYMSHISAWKFLRTLPDGDVSMTIIRHSS